MDNLLNEIREFIQRRDWEQFHTPKNLAMALSTEVAEILEIFQWKQPEEPLNDAEREALKQEIGDTLIYLLELADQFEIDILEVAREKLKLNDKKYPAEIVRGKADKYTKYK
ncbi:MAG: nucleotide pyrophosphohydrolase [Anaerolineales bacterium]